jgi:glycerol-3-phosphate acyltransferase PlsY
MSPWVCLVIAYIAGSIPSAYVAGKLKGVDLRKHGSGNLGATNVARVLGARIGAAVFAVDVMKGFLSVYFLPGLADTLRPEAWAIAFGVAAIAGHVKPVFLLWRGGGKGVATAAGVFAALAPIPSLVAFAIWFTVFLATRYVSVASLAGAVALPLSIFLINRDDSSTIFAASCVVALFVIWTHRANIARLRSGDEHRFVKKEAGS